MVVSAREISMQGAGIVTCSHCGHEPPPGSTFCNGCGAKLAIVCAGCGTTPPPSSRFCNACGATLGGAPAATSSTPDARGPRPQPTGSDARKVVTILFADLAGSTALHERLDPESVRAFMERYYRVMRAAVAARGGTLVKLLGDGVMAAFGVPHVAEDDAIRAVRAGIAMQEEFRSLAHAHADIDLRVAINTGEVVVSADNADVVGDPVNVAARLQQEARPGDVVLGENTRRLVAARVTLESLGSFALRGRAEQVKAYRVVSLERPTGAAAVAFVGRADELGRLRAVYDAAVAAPAARLAVLLGSPGLGKSRLIDEVTQRLGDAATVISAHCDAAGGATFAPIAQALHEFAGGGAADDVRAAIDAALPVTETERARIAGGIGNLLAGASGSPEETFFVIRRFLTGLAARKPVVLAIDDLQWAEPLLLDLVEHLVQWGGGVPLLVLVGARPELRELRPSLVTTGGCVSDVVTLSGLDAGAAMRLAANVIGASDLPAAVAAKVLSTSEGNPLFVGELARMLVDQGALERRGDRWIIGANLAALEMPPTIHALLAARIERLRAEERTVLEHASVVGRHFSRSAVSALLGEHGSELDARLEALRRTELIEPDTGRFLGEPVLRFRHVLIRDAAYRRLLKGTRAALHAQLADWIETKVGDAAEHDETIGRHLEQAHQLLSELGTVDDAGRRLGMRAAARLAAAGRRALAGDDVPLAANLLGRAIERLENGDPARAELVLDWSEALLSAGDVGQAKTALAELTTFVTPPSAAATADERKAVTRLAAWHTCFTGQLTVLTAPQGLQTAASAVAAAAQELATLGDAAGEAKAHFVHALALARLGEIGGCEAALDRALAAARGAGDRRRANTVLAIAPLAALWGPSAVPRASGRCLDVVRVLRITQGAPAVEAVALSCQGVLEALRGRTEAARRMIAAARQMVEELGITQRLLETDVSAGLVELLEGDAPAAERKLRGAYEGLRDLGLGIDAARAAALLARARLAVGRVADAEALSHESELLAGDDLKAAIAWRGVRAEALARRGEHAAAVELATKAVELAAATDALLDHADARLALAAALRAAGRRTEADVEERRARDLWDAKGATLLAERAERAATPREVLFEYGADGRLTGEAVARFDALSDGGETEPFANAASHAFDASARCWQARDWNGVVATYHPAHRMDDRRRLMRMEVTGDAFFANERVLFADTASHWHGALLATRGERLALFHVRFTATVDGSGPMEVEALDVVEVDGAGLRTALVVFDPEDLDAAHAELDARYVTAPSASFENAATRAIDRATTCFEARDWPGIEATVDPAGRYQDRRRLMRLATDAAGFLAGHRVVFDVPGGRWWIRPLATRGERLSLHRSRFEGDVPHGGGRIDFEDHLCLVEAGTDGRVVAIDLFDLEDIDAAYVELDRRYEAGEATLLLPLATSYLHALAERDWGAIAALYPETFVERDHRSIALLGTARGAEAWAQDRALVELAPDTGMRFDHIRSGPRAVLSQMTWFGSRAGAAYEIVYVVVSEIDENGTWNANDLYDPEQLDQALARFAALNAAAREPKHSVENAASRTSRRRRDAFNGRDWAGIEACAAPSVVFDDRRRLCRVTADREQWLAMLRFLFDTPGSRFSSTLLATRGDRLALHRLRFQAAVADGGGPLEIGDHLALEEVDRDGRIATVVLFDLEDEGAAYAELAARWRGAEPAPERSPNAATRVHAELERRWVARDWEGSVARYRPTYYLDDRRRLIRLKVSGDAFQAQLRMLFDTPRSRFHFEPLATRGERLALGRVLWEADVDDSGGTLDAEYLEVFEVDDAEMIVAAVLFDPTDEAGARAELEARFADISARR